MNSSKKVPSYSPNWGGIRRMWHGQRGPKVQDFWVWGATAHEINETQSAHSEWGLPNSIEVALVKLEEKGQEDCSALRKRYQHRSHPKFWKVRGHKEFFGLWGTELPLHTGTQQLSFIIMDPELDSSPFEGEEDKKEEVPLTYTV